MPFRALLQELLASAPRARGAVFCDQEGEHVEFALRDPPPRGCTALSDYDLKVYGAQVAAAWLSLQQGITRSGAGATRELKLTCASGTLLCRGIGQGYYLTLLLAPGPSTEAAAFVLRSVAARVEAEI